MLASKKSKSNHPRQGNTIFDGAGLARNLQILLDASSATMPFGVYALTIWRGLLRLFGRDLKPRDHDVDDFVSVLPVPEEVDSSERCADRTAQKIGLFADIFVRSAEPGHR